MSDLPRRAARKARWAYRRATAPARRLPGFLVLGAQRAGSTSLFDDLCSHPGVVEPTHKELHFFDQNWWRGVGWYRRFFPVARDRVTGEASPYYLFHPLAPARVAATVPHARLIALLRDPVERAYSHYHLSRRYGHEELSFEEALDHEAERLAGEEEKIAADPGYKSFSHRHHSYLARGLYAAQLERWFGYFPREQIHVVRAEDLFADPAGTYGQILSFLGLAPHELPRPAHRNKAEYAPMEKSTREHLTDFFREPNRRLYELLGRDLRWGSRERAAATSPGGKKPAQKSTSG
ncbi:MAG: sulfotransferase domain-containing protein [Gaiellaceae bacterium]